MARIHFLNVNEGDCSIIQHENGNVSMIDICCGNIEIEDHSNCSSVDLKETILGNYHQLSQAGLTIGNERIVR